MDLLFNIIKRLIPPATGWYQLGCGEARRGRSGHSKKREKHPERGRSVEKEDRRVTDAPSPASR